MPQPPLGERMAAVETEVANLKEEVHGLKRALWAFVFTVLGGVLIFLLTIVTGVIGHTG